MDGCTIVWGYIYLFQRLLCGHFVSSAAYGVGAYCFQDGGRFVSYDDRLWGRRVETTVFSCISKHHAQFWYGFSLA